MSSMGLLGYSPVAEVEPEPVWAQPAAVRVRPAPRAARRRERVVVMCSSLSWCPVRGRCACAGDAELLLDGGFQTSASVGRPALLFRFALNTEARRIVAATSRKIRDSGRS